MSTPRPRTPIDVAHEQHDALLIAQLAAGDPLEASQLHEASQLVATCRGCAALAADLRAISGAVAWEPVPPRRRDFRIDATQAEQLRGSAWTRFLRRVSLPRSSVLRPAAAGVMSLGLVLVVAGSVWPVPDAGSEERSQALPQASVLVEEPPAPLATTSAAGAPLERMTTEAALPTLEGPGEDTEAADDDVSAEVRGEPAFEGFDSSSKASTVPSRERDTSAGEAVERAPARGVGQDTPGDRRADAPGSPLADELGPAAAADPSLPDTPAADSMALEALEAAAPAPTSAPASRSAAAPTMATALETAAPTSAAALQGPPGDGPDEVEPARPEEAESDTGTTEVATASATSTSSFGIETALVVVGAILAIGGAVVLLLAWLSRRAADPLLR